MSGGHALLNVSSGRVEFVRSPNNVSMNLRYGDLFSLVALGSEATLYFAAMEPTGDATAVYRYLSADRSTSRLSPAGVTDFNVESDGKRVAWRRLLGVDRVPFSVIVADVANPTVQQVLAPSAQQSFLCDGLVVWRETTPTSNRLKVNDGLATTTITSNISANIVAVGGGAVAYSKDSQLWLWSSARGSRKVLDFLVLNAQLSSDYLYVVVGDGESGAMYRVAL